MIEIFKLALIYIVIIYSTLCQDAYFVSPQNAATSAITTYQFAIQIDQTLELLELSPFTITFPQSYQNRLLNNSYTCSLESWIANPIPNIKCQFSYPYMYINDILPTNTTLQGGSFFIINIRDIINPISIQTTKPFVYKFMLVDGGFYINQGDGLTFSPSQMRCSIQSNPRIINLQAQLVVNCLMPQFINGLIMELILNSKWVQSQVQPTNVIPSNNISCKTAYNLNLECYYTLSNPNSVIRIHNFTSTINTNVSISFSIFSIQNPPTTKPQGTFQLISLYNNNKMSQTINSQLINLLPGSINQVSILPDNLMVNSQSQLLLAFRTKSILQETDVISIKFPKEISLNQLIQVYLVDFGVSLNQINRVGQIVRISGIKAYRGNAVTLIFNKIINPSSQAQTQKFIISTQRSGYMIDLLDIDLTYSARRSYIINSNLSCQSLQIGQVTNCQINMILNHNLSIQSAVIVQFPFIYYDRVTQCSPIPCSITATKAIFQLTNKTKGQSLNLKLLNLNNPLILGTTTSFILYTLLNKIDSTSIVQFTNKNLSLNLIPRKIILNNINITSNSRVRNHYPTSYYITIKNMNNLPPFSYLQIYLPPEMQYMSNDKIMCQLQQNFALECSSYTKNGYKVIKISYFSSQIIEKGKLSQKTIIINNIGNPKTMLLTSTFKFYIYNPLNQIIQYIDNLLFYNISQNFSFKYINIQSSNHVNSQSSELLLTFNLPTNILYTNNSYIQLTFSQPINTQIQPSLTCIPISNNIISLSSCKIGNHSISFLIHYNQLTSNIETQIKLIPYFNYYSFQPNFIVIDLYVDESKQSKICSNQLSPFQLKNSISGRIHLNGYQFKDPIMHSLSNLTIIVKNVSSDKFTYMLVNFPKQFSLVNAYCSLNFDYACILMSNYVLKISFFNSNYTFPIALMLNNVLTPSSSPSTNIYVQSYSASNYLMDRNSQITFNSLCSLPCKTCLNQSAPFTCTGCYHNLTFEDRIILFDNRCISNCTSGEYFSQTTQQCQLCGYNCAVCTSNQTCFVCQNNSSLFNFTCIGECPLGYFSYFSRCMTCSTILKCQTCSNNSCLTCVSEYLLFDNQCVDECPQSQFYQNKVNKTCEACPQYCEFCSNNNSTSFVECSSCMKGYVLEGNRCFAECQIISNLALDGICQSCFSTCLTCSGSINNCTQCKAQPVAFFMNFTCLSQCPVKYYANATSYKCIQCAQPCQNCINSSADSCLTCLFDYFQLQNQCLTKCPKIYYSMNMICLLCKYPCLQCQSQLTCLSCVNNTYLFQKQCLAKCPPGMMAINFTCLACPVTCRSCTAAGCISCISGTYFYNNICIYNCPDGSYSNNLTLSCQLCKAPCNNCGNLTFCTSCINTTFIDPELGKCLSCSSPCFTCQKNSNRCLSCQSKTPSLFYFNYTCMSNCPPKYYQSKLSSNFQCLICNQQCAQCLGNKNNCTICILGFNFYDNKCLLFCPSGTYIDFTDNKCQQCSSNCRSCINQTICTSCSSTLYLNGDQCLPSCTSNASIILNSICNLCQDNCKTCLLSNYSFCTSCFNHDYLLKNKCSHFCQHGYYSDLQSGYCLPCLSPCQSCLNQNECTSCINSSNVVIDRVCKQCFIDCLTCSGTINNCTSCPSINNILFLGRCLLNCPIGYYLDNNTCLSCHYSCQSCINNQNSSCTNCNIGWFLSDFMCVIQCPSGFYSNISDNKCYRCSNSCTQCLDSIICTSCPLNFYLNGSSCSYNCSIAIVAISYICQICNNNCKTCLSSLNNQKCTSCTTGKYYYNFSCFQTCLTGYYSVNGQCLPCLKNCLQCSNLLICTHCLDDKKTILVNQSCLKCHFSCQTCLQSINQCQSCSVTTGFPYFLNKKCLSNCPQRYFTDNFLCMKCQKNCQQCLSLLQCMKCKSFMLMQNKTCVYQCSNDFYQYNTTCFKCNYPCQKCFNDKICTSCQLGYKLQGSNCVVQCSSNITYPNLSICLFCNQSCLTCLSNDILYCTSCIFTLFQYNGRCISICEDTFYGNIQTGRCETCKNLCLSCINITYCQTCKNNTYLFKQSMQCVQNCDFSGYFNDISIKQCSPCSQHCINCENSSYCTQCMNKSYVIVNNQCQKCSDICETCALHPNSCTSCHNDKYLYKFSCINNCPQTFYENKRQCHYCSSGCKQCSNSTYCLACIDSYLKIKEENSFRCMQKCPLNYAYNINNFSCYQSLSTIFTNKKISSEIPQFLWLIIWVIFLIILIIIRYKYEQTFFSLMLYSLLSLSSSACLINLIIMQSKGQYLHKAVYLLIVSAILQILLSIVSFIILIKLIIQNNKAISFWSNYIILKIIIIILSLLDFNSFFLIFTNFMHLQMFNIKIGIDMKSMQKLYFINIISTIIIKALDIAYNILLIYENQNIITRLLSQKDSFSNVKLTYGIQFLIISSICIILSIYLLHFFYNQQQQKQIEKGQSHHSLNSTLKQVFDKRNQSSSQIVLELDNNDLFEDNQNIKQQDNNFTYQINKKIFKKNIQKIQFQQKIEQEEQQQQQKQQQQQQQNIHKIIQCNNDYQERQNSKSLVQNINLTELKDNVGMMQSNLINNQNDFYFLQDNFKKQSSYPIENSDVIDDKRDLFEQNVEKSDQNQQQSQNNKIFFDSIQIKNNLNQQNQQIQINNNKNIIQFQQFQFEKDNIYQKQSNNQQNQATFLKIQSQIKQQSQFPNNYQQHKQKSIILKEEHNKNIQFNQNNNDQLNNKNQNLIIIKKQYSNQNKNKQIFQQLQQYLEEINFNKNQKIQNQYIYKNNIDQVQKDQKQIQPNQILDKNSEQLNRNRKNNEENEKFNQFMNEFEQIPQNLRNSKLNKEAKSSVELSKIKQQTFHMPPIRKRYPQIPHPSKKIGVIQFDIQDTKFVEEKEDNSNMHFNNDFSLNKKSRTSINLKNKQPHIANDKISRRNSFKNIGQMVIDTSQRSHRSQSSGRQSTKK